VLVEADAAQLERNRAAARAGAGPPGVRVALRLVVYDCGNVTWTGVREVLSRNAEMAPGGGGRAARPTAGAEDDGGPTAPEHDDEGPNYAHGIVALKAFYTWQQTVNEHNRRTLAGAFARASRLERKWAAFMMAGEEQAAAAGGAAHGGGGGGILAGAAGGGTAARRRRRRVREALEAVAGEEGIGNAEVLAGGAVRRRRARSAGFASAGGACVVM
jgi:F-box/leucine-rich repeat protein 2/20